MTLPALPLNGRILVVDDNEDILHAARLLLKRHFTSVQTLSDQTGIISQRSWCFDENGVLYFMGNAGFYRLQKGGLPEAISGQRLKRALDRINIDTTRVTCRYDSFYRRVMIYLTPLDGSASASHWVYDVAGDNFFPVKYPLRFGPWSACSIVGGQDIDRTFLVGGDDGYIQRPDPAVLDDDGNTFESYVRSAPIRLGAGTVESSVMELHATGVPGTGPVEWYWLTGRSPEEVSRQTIADAVQRGTLFANGATGFEIQDCRARGAAHQLILRQNSKTKRWGIEEITAFFEPMGDRR